MTLIPVRVVNGYPFEGRKYQLYAYVEAGSYVKVIDNKKNMVHSGDLIDIASDEWTFKESTV